METPVILPKDLFKRFSGIGIDFGSSAIKVIIAKEDDGKVRFNITRFSSDKLKEALLFIKENAEPKLLRDGDNISSVGVQVNLQADLFQQILGIRPRKLTPSEGDTIIDGFMFLAKHLTTSEFLCELSEEALAAGSKMAATWRGLVPHLSGAGRTSRMAEGTLQPELMPATVPYPVILSHYGSGTFIMQLHEDGRYDFLDLNVAGGRTFLGLGNLLSGCKNFADLMSMAEKGDFGKVHQLLSNVDSGDNDNEFYKMFAGDKMAFAFGNAAKEAKGDVKKEDRIAGLLSYLAVTIAKDTFNCASAWNIQHCYFTGGFASFPLLQRLITKEFQSINMSNPKGFRAAHHFVRHGCYVGAIGTLIADMA